MASSLAFFSSSSSSSLALCRSRASSDHLARLCPSLRTARVHPLDCKLLQISIGFWRERNIVHASANGTAVHVTSMSDEPADYVPMPVVLIDQNADSDATVVQLSFGDRLGALIDTMRALKDLGLDVSKGIVTTEGPVKQTKFHITRLDTGRKVEDPELLERIRLTIINNLLEYHPESSAQLALGEAFGIRAPEKKVLTLICPYHMRSMVTVASAPCVTALGKMCLDDLTPEPYLGQDLDVDIATRIHVKEDGLKRSLLYVETADRPGLLVDIIKNLADINIDVESAEIDTQGLVAKDKFYVSYGGAALNSSLSQVLVNCLRYYLRRPETDIDSY